jgi:protein-tyrosine phosphatase
MESGRIDVHTHLLPGIDDGCETPEDSVFCARALVDAGYTHCFCTPHIWPSFPNNTREAIAVAVERLQARFDREGIPLKLMPGGEMNLESLWPLLKRTPDEQLVTYRLAGEYALFDFWAESWEASGPGLEEAIANLQSRGLKLILAHPERIAALQRDYSAIEKLVECGVLLQLNSWCLAESPERPMRRLGERLLREKKYFLIGTDLHQPAGMAIRIRGLQAARVVAGEGEFDRLTKENPRILAGLE